jgi:hypothetical protein
MAKFAQIEQARIPYTYVFHSVSSIFCWWIWDWGGWAIEMQVRLFKYEFVTHPTSFYKSVEDFWDGEVWSVVTAFLHFSGYVSMLEQFEKHHKMFVRMCITIEIFIRLLKKNLYKNFFCMHQEPAVKLDQKINGVSFVI